MRSIERNAAHSLWYMAETIDAWRWDTA